MGMKWCCWSSLRLLSMWVLQNKNGIPSDFDVNYNALAINIEGFISQISYFIEIVKNIPNKDLDPYADSL